MKKKFSYSKLAITNIRKNSRLFIPYIITGVFTVMMFYIMMFIANNSGINKMPGAEALQTIMMLGSIVIAIFAVIILLYTNSFLIKRRKKELALYNILGMEKKHIGKIMLIETCLVALFCILIGLALGILLSKLMLLILFKLLSFSVPFGFEISFTAVVFTVLLFGVIYLLTLLINLKEVHFSKPVELLYGGKRGEKEPKTKIITAILGVLCLATGYTIAIVVKSPLTALGLFFIAVILVIIGTYFLFLSGSIAVLKLLRKNKKYYYKAKHFTSVSSMLYRMKQNAVGLANICILSTMVLVMLSTTVAMFFGLEDGIRLLYPRNIEVQTSSLTKEDCANLEKAIDETLINYDISGKVNYKYARSYCSYENNTFSTSEISNFGTTTAIITAMSLNDFNAINSDNKALNEDEIFIFTPNGKYISGKLSIAGLEYNIKENISDFNIPKDAMSRFSELYYIIVPTDEHILKISNACGQIDVAFSYSYAFDVDCSSEDQILLANRLNDVKELVLGKNTAEHPQHGFVSCAESSRKDFLSLYGGFFFLGIFLGALFIMATVVIMYYKQISEGYDDKERFDIMQKVGMSKDEIKKSIKSQVLTVFFLPLVVAGLHIIASFKMILRLLSILNMTNVLLFTTTTIMTFIIFGIVYALIYALTARAYYKIVE